MRIFLTGPRGVGKSTVLNKVLDELKNDFRLIGYKTKKMPRGVMFKSYDGSRIWIGIMINGKMKPIVENIETMAKLMDNFKASDDSLLFIDEIGFLEEKVQAFHESLEKLVDRFRRIIGIVREGMVEKYDFLLKYSSSRLIEVTVENRNQIVDDLVKTFRYGVSSIFPQ